MSDEPDSTLPSSHERGGTRHWKLGTSSSLTIALILVGLLVAGARLYDETTASARVSLVKHYTPADRQTGRYQYVPFEVPPGTGALRITYEYNRADSGNVIDLGLFEPGSLELGSRAFRGYSGGAKPGITIDRDGATPGYRPGPLPPGRWHVLLGLYRVRDIGVDVTITIETDAGAAPAAPAAPVAPVAPVAPAAPAALAAPVHRTAPVAPVAPDAPGSKWFLGALHTHTLHSDGTVEPLELLRMFRDARFDFVAITDHNNTTHRYEVQRRYPAGMSPLWIAGEEVTTPNGHASVWGLDEGEWVDFRVRAEEKRIGELVASARRYGALFSINHPASECVGCGWDHEIVDDIEGIEISNGRHGELANALAIWDKLLGTGRRITGVGSSDWHSAPNPIDVANVRVFAPALTESAILAAIRNGRVIVMTSARYATPDVAVGVGNTIARVGESLTVRGASTVTITIDAADLAGGRVEVVMNGERATPVTLDARGQARFERRAERGYVRFVLHAADGALAAITNPVYLVRQ